MRGSLYWEGKKGRRKRPREDLLYISGLKVTAPLLQPGFVKSGYYNLELQLQLRPVFDPTPRQNLEMDIPFDA